MLAAVAHESRMRQPAGKDGKVTTRVALETSAARGVASALSELQGPEVPEPVEYLWSWFLELDRTRGYGMNGPEPLTYQAIEAWARLTDRAPTPGEVETLLQMDL